MLTSDQDNFIKMFERSFKEHWDLPAVTDYGTPVTLTYQQLAERVAMLHLVFRACGIKKGRRMWDYSLPCFRTRVEPRLFLNQRHRDADCP